MRNWHAVNAHFRKAGAMKHRNAPRGGAGSDADLKERVEDSMKEYRLYRVIEKSPISISTSFVGSCQGDEEVESRLADLRRCEPGVEFFAECDEVEGL